jgi:hypothetical protein
MNNEYLVGHGVLGDLGRFRAADAVQCRRGDEVVVRTARGIELGKVLCEANPRLAALLSDRPPGSLLRPAGPEDRRLAERMRLRAGELCEEANRLGTNLRLPLAVLDAEVLLDGEHALLLLVRSQKCDIRPLVSALSKAFAVHLSAEDLTHEVEHGCGNGECGSCGADGCGSGGCGSGSCGSASAEEVQAYFAGLREQMMARNRVPLL